MSKATIPASLGGVEFDCIISRERSYEADVPEYPVEDGYYVSDSILRKPMQLDITAFVTNMPVTWAKRHSGSNRVKTITDALLDLYYAGELVSFVTPDKVYENMAITKLGIPEEDYLNAVEISITLKEVTITSAETTTVSSYDYSGSSSDSAGSTGTTEEESTTTKQSILSSIFSGLLD